jgi:hypothetical protein
MSAVLSRRRHILLRSDMFRIVFNVLLGLAAGAIAGGAVCTIMGLLWINAVEANCSNESCAIAVVADMAPLGIVVGGLVGAIWLAILTVARRRRQGR